MATDLSRLRELLERIWKHCEPILPDHPGPGEHMRIFPDFKPTLGKWGPSCATVSSALEGSAKWCERLKRPEDAKWLRAANTRLNKLWDSTFANLTPEVRKMLFQPLEGETIQQFADGRMSIPWLERANDYSGNNLCKHIRRVGCYARQLLHLLEAVEVRENVDGEADGGTRRTWQDAAERMERLRQQGEAAATLVLAQVQAAERPSTRTSPYTVADVARQLHTSPDTVRGWIKSGQLAAANLATGSRPRYVITKADLDAFLKSRRPQPTIKRQCRRQTANSFKRYRA